MQSQQHLPQRRSFFGKLALLGSALLLAPFSRPRPARPGNPDTELQTQQTAYRLTPHIRKYYETAAR
ncbi:MAG: formate dehydrogenase [Desulfobacteraceae bacterium]|nr:MAG: formate dehydrogenase [Desulfobacteraceae bacterium]